jgi:drug/metabolite transporter (DMT)-like permease
MIIMAAALRMTAREWGLLVILSVLWGGAFFMASIALKEATPLGLAFSRIAIAALALAALGWLMGLPFPRRFAEWRAFAILALVGNAIPFVLLYWAQTQITGGLASILNAMTPVFTILLAHVATRDEKIDLRRFLGVLIAVGGVATIVGPSALAHGGALWPEIAVLGAACCYAVASVYARRFRAYPPITTSLAQLVVGAFLLLPFVLFEGAPFRGAAPSVVTLLCILALGLLSTALAFIIFFRVLSRAGAANTALVTLLVPVSAILLGALVLGDTLVARQYAGLALIACGLLVIDGRLFDFLRGLMSRWRGKPDASGRSASPMLNEPQQSQ